ncbi:MAG: hypothetical protein NC911_00555 [Candidatus Omnitrophica bacterium]|nr:hypothetical protein [Candidatus Omnitrophota bacterium]
MKSGKILFLSWLGLLIFPARGIAYYRLIEAEDCALEPGGFQIHQNIGGGYSGEGYMIILWKARQSNGRLLKRLEDSLPPGRYRLSLLTFVEGENNANQVQLNLNGSSIILTWPNKTFRPGEKSWISGEVETKEPGNIFSLQVNKAHDRLIIDSFRIETVLVPQVKELPRPGNLVGNSSFEGLTADWFTPYQCGYALLPGYIDETQASHGRFSLRLPKPMTVISRPYPVMPGEKYSLSVQARVAQAGQVTVGLAGEMAWRNFLQKKFSLTPEQGWQRLVLTGTVPADFKETMIKIEFSVPGWLDAVQLEKGEVTDYRPENPVSLGFLWIETGRVFLQGNPASLRVILSGSGTETVLVSYSVYDWQDRLVAKKQETVTLSQGYLQNDLRLSTQKTGIYRLKFAEPEKKELTYAVVPPYPESDSSVGAYLTLKEESFNILSRMGIRWNNTLSCGGMIATWSQVEPEKGKFLWADEAVALGKKYGFKFLVNLHTGFPRWALSSEPPDQPHLKTGNQYFKLSDWENFVEKTVEHYRENTKHWLVIDEPYHQFSPEEYGKLLAATNKVIKKVAPKARVFAHGGFYDTFLPKVIETVGPECFDGISDYCRRKEHAELISGLAKKYKKVFWSVEYGGYPSFFSEEPEPDSLGSREAIYRLLFSAIRSLCWGQAEKYFRYDARYPGPYPAYQRYCTMFEHDGSLKAAAVAYAVLNKLVSGYQGKQEMKTVDRRVKVFHFQKDEESLLAVWSESGNLYRCFLPEKLGGWKILDAMGNELETFEYQGKLGFLLGKMPVYLCRLKTENLSLLKALHLEESLMCTTEFLPGQTPGILAVKAVLTNRLDRKISGSLGFSRESQYLLRPPGERHRFSLAPGESHSFVFPLNYGPRDILENKLAELEVGGPEIDSHYQYRLSYAGCQKRSFPVNIDGDSVEWSRMLDWQDNQSLKIERETVKPEEPDRSAGRCLLVWDEENLYLCFYLSFPQSWPDQTLQIFLQAEEGQGQKLVFFPIGQPAKLTGPLADKVTWAIKESPRKRYTLEMKIPWADVGIKAQAGKGFFFNAILSRTEGKVTVSEKAWAAKPGEQKEQPGLGYLFLLKE